MSSLAHVPPPPRRRPPARSLSFAAAGTRNNTERVLASAPRQELRLSFSNGHSFDVCRSHLALETDDPALGKTFSVETLRNGEQKRGMGVPSMLHGAPETAEVQVCARDLLVQCV